MNLRVNTQYEFKKYNIIQEKNKITIILKELK
jgi:hypothetical protein